MTGFTSDHSYATARALTSKYVALAGATYDNRDWIKSQGGTYNAKTKVWKIPTPSSNKTTVDLLYGITSRHMQWKASR